MKSDAKLTQYTPSGLEFSDGSHVDADVVVFATGFEGNMRLAASSILGREVSDELEDFWGVNEEGELLGAWKPLKCKQGIPISICISTLYKMEITNGVRPLIRSWLMVYWWCNRLCEILFTVLSTTDLGGCFWGSIPDIQGDANLKIR